MPLPSIGTPAPDFTLPSTSGGSVTLSAFRGRKVLLAFFPLAFTSTCTAELCAFDADYDAFEQAGALVLPISVDSIPTLRAYRAQEQMTVDLLSDFRREVCRRYGTLIEEAFLSARAYVVIDAAGVVRWTWREAELGHLRANAELLAQLRAV
ncbi:MAG: redoxin domain-containing protein [Gemmatimonadales bacterium]